MKQPSPFGQQVPVLLENMFLVNPQLNSIVKGVQSMARRRKLTVRMSSSFDEVAAWCRRGKVRAAIVLSCSKAEAASLCRRFYEHRVHPVFTNMQPEGCGYPYSCVMQDYRDACDRIIGEVVSRGAEKIAYVGHNPDSYTDSLRFGELRRGVQEHRLQCDVYENTGDLRACIDAFLRRADEYGAVICANDIIAVLLVRRFDDPESHNIMGFGGMVIGEQIRGFTTAVLDYFGVGSHAVEIFSLLVKEQDIGNITMTVTSRLAHEAAARPRAVGGGSHSERKRIDFYGDGEVQRTSSLENLLLNCDDVDRGILRCLLRGDHYSAIEENNYISLNTIKYRIGKMIKNAEVADKAALLDLLRNFDIDFGE